MYTALIHVGDHFPNFSSTPVSHVLLYALI